MYARFGQELHTRETITAAAAVASAGADANGRALVAKVADALPQASPTTRQRLAVKLLQRLAAGSHAHPEARPSSLLDTSGSGAVANGGVESFFASSPGAGPGSFARLIAGIADTQARGDLVYYGAARADGLVEAIAREILYPYFIESRIPPPYTEDEFLVANGFLLLAPEPIITAGFVAEYAQRVWGFECGRTVALALRILHQAGILLSSPLLGERGRIHAYTLSPHGISFAACLWCLYEEFNAENTTIAWDRVACSAFARMFVIPPSVVTSRLWEAERAGLIGFWSAGGTRRISLKIGEREALICLLLAGAG